MKPSLLLAMGLAASPVLSLAQTGGGGPAVAVAADDSYKIRAGDLLQMTVYPQAELSGSYVVFEDGVVQLPTVGRLQLRGKSREEAASAITESLSKYFVKPRISLTIIKFTQRNVVVAGQVRFPGALQYQEGLTLTEAIAQTGGTTPEADRRVVRLYRGDPENRQVQVVDVESIMSGVEGAKDIPLSMGDLVEVQRIVNIIYVWGAIKSPGRLDFFQDMTIHDLIARAGGLDNFAATDRIRIFRTDGAIIRVRFDKVLSGDLEHNVRLSAGDIVVIPAVGLARASGWLNLLTPWLSLFGFLVNLLILGAVL